jgi:hypothetical protein
MAQERPASAVGDDRFVSVTELTRRLRLSRVLLGDIAQCGVYGLERVVVESDPFRLDVLGHLLGAGLAISACGSRPR